MKRNQKKDCVDLLCTAFFHLHHRLTISLGHKLEHIPSANGANALRRITTFLIFSRNWISHRLHRRLVIRVPALHAQSF